MAMQQEPAVSFRWLLLILGLFGVIVVSVVACGVLITADEHARHVLADQAHASIEGLASAFLSQSLEDSAASVRTYFRAVVAVATQQLENLRYLNATDSLDLSLPSTRHSLIAGFRRALYSMPEPSLLSLASTDGYALVVADVPVRYALQALPRTNATASLVSSTWDDPVADGEPCAHCTTLPASASPANSLLLPNVLQWSPTVSLQNGSFLSLTAAFYTAPQIGPQLWLNVSCNVSTLSSVLKGAATFGSVFALAHSDGTLLAASHETGFGGGGGDSAPVGDTIVSSCAGNSGRFVQIAGAGLCRCDSSIVTDPHGLQLTLYRATPWGGLLRHYQHGFF